jgi:hypothetical protein
LVLLLLRFWSSRDAEVKSFAFEEFSAFVLEVGICFEFSLLRMYSHGIGSCVRLFCESVALHWFAAVFLSVCLSTLVGSVCLSESVVRRSCGEEVLWRSVEAGTFLLLLLLSQLYFEKTTIPLLGWSWDLLERERYGGQGMHPTLVYLCAVGAAKVFPSLVKKLL